MGIFDNEDYLKHSLLASYIGFSVYFCKLEVVGVLLHPRLHQICVKEERHCLQLMYRSVTYFAVLIPAWRSCRRSFSVASGLMGGNSAIDR